jgi:hypothetical protein
MGKAFQAQHTAPALLLPVAAAATAAVRLAVLNNA